MLDSALGCLGKDSETCGDLVFIKNTRKKYSGIQVFYEEGDEMLQKILADMECDRGFTVPCNTKKQADRVMMKLQEEANQVATLQELQDRAFNEETDEDDYSDTEFSRLYKQALWHDNIMRSSFQYQLDGLLTRRGFEVNRRSISQLANRDVEKAHRLIGNAEADRRCTQQAKDKVEAYFTGMLSDSIADVQWKKLLDEKVGSLLGIKTTQVAREYEMVEQHRDRIHRFVSENPNEREICLEIFVEPKAVDQLRNMKLAAYTEEKLKSIDEYYSTRDFAACNLTRLPAHNKVQLLKRLLDVFNRDLPPTCTPLKAYDLTLKQACMTRTKESLCRMRYGSLIHKDEGHARANLQIAGA